MKLFTFFTIVYVLAALAVIGSSPETFFWANLVLWSSLFIWSCLLIFTSNRKEWKNEIKNGKGFEE